MTTVDELLAYVRTWKGCPWQHQGRGDGPKRGIDCAGLLVCTAKHFGLPYEDLMGYGRQPDRSFMHQIRQFTYPQLKGGPIPGSIGIFTDNVLPCHVGIFGEDSKGRLTLIHAEVMRRIVHEQDYITNKILHERLIDVRRFQEVDYVL